MTIRTFTEQKSHEALVRKEWLQSLASTGMYLSEAAKLMGMAQSTLGLMATNHGVTFKSDGNAKHGQKMIDQRLDRYRPLIAKGMNINGIAAATGEKRKNVYSFMKSRFDAGKAAQ